MSLIGTSSTLVAAMFKEEVSFLRNDEGKNKRQPFTRSPSHQKKLSRGKTKDSIITKASMVNLFSLKGIDTYLNKSPNPSLILISTEYVTHVHNKAVPTFPLAKRLKFLPVWKVLTKHRSVLSLVPESLS